MLGVCVSRHIAVILSLILTERVAGHDERVVARRITFYASGSSFLILDGQLNPAHDRLGALVIFITSHFDH